MLAVTSPIVVNVPTRSLLAVETKDSFVLWLAKFVNSEYCGSCQQNQHVNKTQAINDTTTIIDANSAANLNLHFQPTNDHPYGRNKTNVT